MFYDFSNTFLKCAISEARINPIAIFFFGLSDMVRVCFLYQSVIFWLII
jgi:hypothetical protein